MRSVDVEKRKLIDKVVMLDGCINVSPDIEIVQDIYSGEQYFRIEVNGESYYTKHLNLEPIKPIQNVESKTLASWPASGTKHYKRDRSEQQ